MSSKVKAVTISLYILTSIWLLALFCYEGYWPEYAGFQIALAVTLLCHYLLVLNVLLDILLNSIKLNTSEDDF